MGQQWPQYWFIYKSRMGLSMGTGMVRDRHFQNHLSNDLLSLFGTLKSTVSVSGWQTLRTIYSCQTTCVGMAETNTTSCASIAYINFIFYGL